MLQSSILSKLTIVLAVPLWFAAPARADVRSNVSSRPARLEKNVVRARPARQVAQSYSRPPADIPGNAGDNGGGPDVAGLDVRVDRLEDQVRTLNGQIEQIQFAIRRLDDQLRKFQQDVDFRFQDNARGRSPARAPKPAGQRQSESGDRTLPPAGASVGQSTATFGAPGPGTQGNDAFNPTTHPSAPGVPHVLGTLPPHAGAQSATEKPPVISAPQAAGAPPLPRGPIGPGLRASNTPLELPSALPRKPNPPPTGASPSATVPPAAAAQSQPQSPGSQVAALPKHTPREDFEAATAAFEGKHFETAEIKFKRFIDKYPQDKLVPRAVFYLGETYFKRNRYRDAAEQYLKISTDYSKTAKAPQSLLRLGESLDKLGAKEQACAAFAEVGRKYPKASARVRATADREAKRTRC